MMQRFQTIRKERLILGYVAAALFILIVVAVGIWGVTTISNSFEKVENEIVQEIILLEEIRNSFSATLLELTTLLLLEPKITEDKERQINLTTTYWDNFESGIEQYEASLQGAQIEQTVFVFDEQELRGIVENIVDKVRAGTPVLEILPYKKSLKELEEEIIFPDIQGKINTAFSRLELESANNVATVRFVTISIIAAGIIGMVLILFLGFLISRREALIDQFREQLISIVSHQLKAPITVIAGHAELLLNNKTLSAEDTETISIVQKSAKNMNTLVRDLLNLTQINQGKFVLENESIDVCLLLDSVVEELKPAAEVNNVKVQLRRPPNSIRIFTDKIKIHQVFKNIVSNGIKYNKKGGVLAVNITKADNMLNVEIKDEGIGIPKNEQKMIFKRFYRASNASAQEHFGTGLGLFIAREIVRQSGGDIIFKSIEQQGTTFSITLPLEKEKKK